MKGLNMADWSLIARYLRQETRNGDLDHLSMLVENHPGLRKEMAILDREVNTPRAGNGAGFDARSAFKRLNERLEHEELI